MGGITALKKLQYGLETTPGVEVNATAQWRGKATLSDERTLEAVPEDWGRLRKPYRTIQPRLLAKITMEGTLTFEQFPVILSAGIDDVVTGTDDGGSGAYYYEYTFPDTELNSIKTYTFRGGDNQRVDVAEYGVVSSFQLDGKPGKAWEVKAEWFCRRAQSGAFTNGVTPQAVEDALFGKTLCYIDASGGTIGSTAITGSLLAVSLKVDCGNSPRFTGDNDAVYFYNVRQTMPEVTGTLTFEHDDVGENELEVARVTKEGAAASECVRLLRLKILGSSIGGTSYPNKTVLIDLPIVYTAVPAIEDEDGDSVISLPFRMVYDSTPARIVVANKLSQLV